MPPLLEVVYPAGTFQQTPEETIAYIIDTAEWGTPSSPAVDRVVKESDNTDATATVMPTNSPSVSGTEITLSTLQSLTAGENYRIDVTCTISGNRVDFYLRVECSQVAAAPS